jgi:hypothetical protein
MTIYTLKLKGTDKLLGFDSIDMTGADFCVSVSYSLCEYSDKIWTTLSKDIAERVANSTTEYYNAEYEYPVNKYIGQIEVAEFSN